MNRVQKTFIPIALLLFAFRHLGSARADDRTFIGFKNGEFRAEGLDQKQPAYIEADQTGNHHSVRIILGMPEAIQPAQASQLAPPEPPKRADIIDGDRFLRGALSELEKGSGIYLGSRHVIEGASSEAMRAALPGYRFYEFRVGDAPVDAILAIPAGKESRILEIRTPGQAPCNTSDETEITYELRDLSAFKTAPEPGDQFASPQLGTFNGSRTEQMSTGTIQITGVHEFYLPFTSKNHTSPRSSGSLVYLKKPGARLATDWQPAGIVQCIVPKSEDPRTGAPIPAMVRVYAIHSLQDAVIRQIPLEKLTREPELHTPNCSNVDGKGGGG